MWRPKRSVSWAQKKRKAADVRLKTEIIQFSWLIWSVGGEWLVEDEDGYCELLCAWYVLKSSAMNGRAEATMVVSRACRQYGLNSPRMIFQR